MPSKNRINSFHGYFYGNKRMLWESSSIKKTYKHYFIKERELSYRITAHFHPYSQELMDRLIAGSASGLFNADTDYVKKNDGSFERLPSDDANKKGKFKPTLYSDILTKDHYDPSEMVKKPYPVKDLDFTSGGAYSVYNWELFFHTPLTIAMHLSKNQRFADAQRWFHHIFDPTDDSDGPTPERFWKVRPFHYTEVKKIEEILINLATGQDASLRDETIRSIEAWKDEPFRPHAVARYRQQSYMYKTVMAYLDNLIAWGDSLFRQDTGEAIDEAMMLYVLAANILGPRPQPVPKKGSIRPQTYANLRADLDKFGNAMREMESDVPFDLLPFPSDSDGSNEQLSTIRSLGKALYFCVPRNDKLLSYWDTVADRLFKIRNSLNFQGTFRQLALFEPPIDPGMLAKATAAGLDISAIVNGLNQPLPLIRFQLSLQKATDICHEVKSLGNSLLAAMEKEDLEAMTIMRAKHEKVVMKMVEHIKYAQIQDATKSKEGLTEAYELAKQRYIYYELQLGKDLSEIEIPELDDLDMESLDKMKFSMNEPEVSLRTIKVDIASEALSKASGDLVAGKLLSTYEAHEAILLEAAQASSDLANILNFASSTSHYIPKFQINVEPMGAGSSIEYGGDNVGDAIGATASAARAVSDRLNFEARRAGRIDGFSRRELDWSFQSNLAYGEITQIFKQYRAAQLREHIANKDLEIHRQQMKHAEEIEGFINAEGAEKKGKKTNKSLYTWMKREVRSLYSQSFQFAFDIAKKAERSLQHELGKPDLSYIEFGYLSGKEGLLAGDKLYFDLKRMEMAYHEHNRREYELLKNASLLQLDPLALLQLRATGRCTLVLPESFFDMDGPGHYFRRIKTVAVSIPCIVGPYASVNCKLTLLKSSIRKSQIIGEDEYERTNAEDSRFDDYFGSSQSIVTSSSQNDSGLFETNLRDERYLPFEGSGVISEWQLELPGNPSRKELTQFDYNTVSDVILHIRYTAREGGQQLKEKAAENITNQLKEKGSTRLFSMKHDFPMEWLKFKKQIAVDGQRFELAVTPRPEHYPFWSQNSLNSVQHVSLLAETDSNQLEIFHLEKDPDPDPDSKDELVKVTNKYGDLLFGELSKDLLVTPVSEFKVYLLDNKILKDFWFAITWK